MLHINKEFDFHYKKMNLILNFLSYVAILIYSLPLIFCQRTDVAKIQYNPPSLMLKKKAPYWSALGVQNEKFLKINSNYFIGKYLVMIFYPFDFTKVTPTELIAFSENIDKFKIINTEVLGISTDSHFTHLAWLKTPRSKAGVGKLTFPLIADISKKISRNFQVLNEDERDDLYGASLRALFIIDNQGKIRSIIINNETLGINIEEILRLIQAFQYSDKYGEVCPANWKSGSITNIHDKDNKKEYFENIKNKNDI